MLLYSPLYHTPVIKVLAPYRLHASTALTECAGDVSVPRRMFTQTT